MIVQIYEVQTPEEARLMIESGVDHIGSVLLSGKQLRNAVLKQAMAMVRASGRKSSLIPLFHDVDLISSAIEFFRPDIIHFCETLAMTGPGDGGLQQILGRQKEIRRRFPKVEIMRSIPIAVTGAGVRLPSLEVAALFEPFSDWFLTDTVLVDHAELPSADNQPVAGFVGITGQTCDWGVARELVARSTIPVILAGGIGPDNVIKGIELVKPAGVDSCTQTNAVDDAGRPIRFKKDPDKVRALIQAARQAAVNVSPDRVPPHTGRTDAVPTL